MKRSIEKSKHRGFVESIDESTNRRFEKFSSRGSVIMEYLIVQVLVACALAIFMHDQFFQVEYGRFVGVGQKIQRYYECIFGGLSLPVP